MIPHAIVRLADGLTVNLCSWDRIAEWHPEPGHIAIRIDGLPVAPQIGDVWNQATKTFSAPPEFIRDGKVLLLPNGEVYRAPKIDAPKPTAKAEPIAPERVLTDIPHRDINWALCDRGQQSPEFFRPGAEVERIYEDRMKIAYAEGFYADPSAKPETKETQHGS